MQAVLGLLGSVGGSGLVYMIGGVVIVGFLYAGLQSIKNGGYAEAENERVRSVAIQQKVRADRTERNFKFEQRRTAQAQAKAKALEKRLAETIHIPERLDEHCRPGCIIRGTE